MIRTLLIFLMLGLSLNGRGQNSGHLNKDSLFIEELNRIENCIELKRYKEAFDLLFELKKIGAPSHLSSKYTNLSNWVNAANNAVVLQSNIAISLNQYRDGNKDALVLAERFYRDLLRIAPDGYDFEIDSEFILALPADTIPWNRLNGYPLNLLLSNEDYDLWTPTSLSLLRLLPDSTLFNGVIECPSSVSNNQKRKFCYNYVEGNCSKREEYCFDYVKNYSPRKQWILDNSEEYRGDTIIRNKYGNGNHNFNAVDTIIQNQHGTWTFGRRYVNDKLREKHYSHHAIGGKCLNEFHIQFLASGDVYRKDLKWSEGDHLFALTLGMDEDTLAYSEEILGKRHNHEIRPVYSGDARYPGGYFIYRIDWNNGELRSIQSENALFLNENGKPISHEKFVKYSNQTKDALFPELQVVSNEAENDKIIYLVFQLNAGHVVRNDKLLMKREKSITKNNEKLMLTLD